MEDRQFTHIINELINSAADPVDAVRLSVKTALVEFGSSFPEDVIKRCHKSVVQYMSNGSEQNIFRLSSLFDILNVIICEKISETSRFHHLKELIGTVCKLMEDLKSVDAPHLMKTAINILVHLSSSFCVEVMEHLLTGLENNPNENAVIIFGLIASQQPHNMMHLLPVLLSQTVHPTDPSIDDSMRSAVMITLGQYCDASLEYLASVGDPLEAWDTMVDLLSPHTSPAIDFILSPTPIFAKETQLSTTLLSHIGSIMSFTELDYVITYLPRLLPYLINQLKKSNMETELAVVHSLNSILQTVSKRCSLSPVCCSEAASCDQPIMNGHHPSPRIEKLLETELENLLSCLLNQLVVSSQRRQQSEPADAPLLNKTLNEIKRTFALLCSSYPSRVLRFTESHLPSGSDLSRAVCVDLLRYLISSCDRSCFTDEMRLLILSNLQLLLFHSASSPLSSRRQSQKHNIMGSVVKAAPLSRDRCSTILGEVAGGHHLPASVRYELVKTVLTLGSLGYLDLDGGQPAFIEFVIRQCAAPLPSSEKPHHGCPSQLEIRDLCEHVLKLSSSTVTAMHSVLWPFLLEFVVSPEFTDAVGILCDSIVNILSKTSPECLTEELCCSTGDLTLKLRSYSNVMTPQRLMARLLVLLGYPLRGKTRGLPILRVMNRLAGLFHPTLAEFWDAILPRMIMYLLQEPSIPLDESVDVEGRATTADQRSFNHEHWEVLTLKMLSKSLQRVANEKWTLALLRALENQISFYEHLSEEKGFLFKCISVILNTFTSLDSVVADSIGLIFQSTRHDSVVEQKSCSESFGMLTEAHTNLVVDFLFKEQFRLESSVVRASKPQPPSNTSVPNPGVPNRLSALFRSSVTSPKRSSMHNYPLDKTAVSATRVSCDRTRSTIISIHAEVLQRMSRETVLNHVENLVKDVIHPISKSIDEGTGIRMATINLIRCVVKSVDSYVMAAPDASPSIDLTSLATELSQCLIALLTLDTYVFSSDRTSLLSCTSVIPFRPPSSVLTSLTTTLTSDICVRQAVLQALADVIHLGLTPTCLRGVLEVTAAAALSVNVTTDHRYSPRIDPDESFEIGCMLALELIWTEAVRLYCSEELVAELYMLLICYVHDATELVAVRALGLLTAVLNTLRSELELVNKQGVSPFLTGQLLGHLVTLLDPAGGASVVRETKKTLLELLSVQRIFHLDVPTSELDASQIGVTRGDRCTPSNLLIFSHAELIPKTQLTPLIELIYSGLSCSNFVTDTDNERNHKSRPSAFDVDKDDSDPFSGSSNQESVTSADNSLESMWKISPRSSSVKTHGVSVFWTSSSVKLSKWMRRFCIPISSRGSLITLLIGLIVSWGSELTEYQVNVILNSAHRVYPQLRERSLRAGILQSIAELGCRCSSICLQVVSNNPLPLDDVWSVFLGAIAFLPVYRSPSPNEAVLEKRIYSSTQSQVFSPGNSKLSLEEIGFATLLNHVLKLLDQCQPYEQRDVPVEPTQSTDKRSRTVTSNEGPLIKCANFATHFWLSLVNCLQVLSYPMSLEQLICSGSTDSVSSNIDDSGGGTKPLKKLFQKRTGPLPPTAVSSQSNSNQCPPALVHHLVQPHCFSCLLGHWILAFTTASSCRTPVGKSYETRSGAEANLKYGVKPVSIAVQGMVRFFCACNLSELLSNLRSTPSNVESATDNSVILSTSALTESATTLFDPDNVAENIDVIVGFVVQSLQSKYTLGLVHFFLNHLDSPYEIRRHVAFMVIVSVLVRLNVMGFDTGPNENAEFMPINPDVLLGYLLERLSDSNPVVCHMAVAGLGRIGCGVVKTHKEDGIGHADGELFRSFSNTEDVRVGMIQRHAAKIVGGLLSVIDQQDDSNTALLLTVLESLAEILPCVTEGQVQHLVNDICLRILPIYSSASSSVRAVSFRLFGIMIHFAWNYSDTRFLRPTGSHLTLKSEATSVFVPLVLHLGDSSDEVVRTCKWSLRRVAPLLFSCGSESGDVTQTTGDNVNQKVTRLVDFLLNCLRPDIRLHLGEFYNELSKLLTSHSPEDIVGYATRCTVYFNSERPEIQCSALLFASSLVGHFAEDARSELTRTQISQEFLDLLQSRNPDVRAMSAHALGRIYKR